MRVLPADAAVTGMLPNEAIELLGALVLLGCCFARISRPLSGCWYMPWLGLGGDEAEAHGLEKLGAW